MTQVSLRKLNMHYLLSQADRAERRKLEGLQMKVLDDAFELAIERTGLPKDGELCLRTISAPVRLRLDSSEQSITAHWTAELAQSLADAIRNGPRSRRVFYYSRQQAVFDFALSVSQGEYERAWAWQLLGLWHDRETIDSVNAVRELVQGLTSEPEFIVPAFRHLASLGSLPTLSRKLSLVQWQELSEAALMHAGVFLAGEGSGGYYAAPSSRVFSYALRILKRSRLLAAINYSGALARANETMRRAIVALAILEAEPALLHSQVAPSVVAVVVSSIGTTEAAAVVASSLGTTEAAASEISSTISPEPALSAEREEAETKPTRLEGEWTTPPDELSSQRSHAGRVEQTNDILDPRRRARTDYGGLLFLIAVIDLLELPDQILTDPVLGPRPLTWTLHQLAMALTPVGPTDAAALAFAGLPPDSSPPSEQEPPSTEHETGAVSLLATRMVEYLSSLIILPEGLLEFVCRRTAEIVADPAWFEIHFSLDQVSTEIRRAGLDLDPGYVKWLGLVFKFVYE